MITNHQYFFLGGTEIFTYTLASTLKRYGHEVVIYSPYVGDVIAEQTRKLGIAVVDNINALAGESFDLIHAHHNVTAIEARNVFPKTPMLFLSHGVLPFLERPPLINLGISRFLAVSEEVRDNLVACGIPRKKVVVFRNIIDTERFKPERPIRKRPRRALVLSNTITDEKRRVIERACGKLGVAVKFVGRVGKPVWEVEREINKADIVFSLGRGIMEALSCGRVAVVYDYNGGDGVVTRENIDEIQKCNFSGRRFRKQYDAGSLAAELRKYSRQLGNEGRELVLERFSSSRRIGELMGIYEQVLREKRVGKCDWALVGFLSDAFAVTRQTSLWKVVGDQKVEEMTRMIKSLRAELNGIYKSRSWRIIGSLRRIKNHLLFAAKR